MNKKIYIDGNVAVCNGIFYASEIMAGADESYKIGVDEVIKVDNNTLFVNEDYGSIFNTYIIKGEFAVVGNDNATNKIVSTDYKFTYQIFIDDIDSILMLLNNSSIPDSSLNLFNQQIYISIYGSLENYLFNTFLRQVCRDYKIYKKVLRECIDNFERNKESNDWEILKGKDCLEKEKLFIRKVQEVVFHNQKKVNQLFKSAFGFNSCISSIRSETKIRHDLVHRMGRTIDGADIVISKEQVLGLAEKVKRIVENITKYVAKD